MLRDKGGTFEVKGGTGNIIRMCTVDGHLEIYKIDKTFRAQTPDRLDPERKNPNMPWIIEEHSDIGCKHPVVARILIQSCEILKIADFKTNTDIEKIKSILHDSKETILKCESLMADLADRMEKIEAPIRDSGLGLDEKGRAINPFPKINDLADTASNFLFSAKRCLQNCAILIDHLYKTGIRLPRFDKISKWAKEHIGEKSYLYSLCSENEEKILHYLNLRNYYEHPNDNKRTEITNYKLTPDISINQPMWFITGESPEYILDGMYNFMGFIFEFTEMLFLHGVAENLSNKFPLVLCRHEENKIDENCPIAFYMSIDASKLTFEK